MLKSEDIIFITDNIQIENEINTGFLESQNDKKKIKLVEDREIKSIVITEESIIYTGYGAVTIFKRINEFNNIIGGKSSE